MPVFWKKGRQEPGWLAVSLEADAIRVAQVIPTPSGKPRAGRWGLLAYSSSDQGPSLSKAAKDHDLLRYQCTTLLEPSEYQILSVDAPNVPREELKAAIRWKIKDLLDYHVDDATLDVLEIPSDPEPAGKAKTMYAVAAPNEVVQKRISAFSDARLNLKVIDIPELAQRNVASYFERPDRAVALLSLRHWGGLLTFSFQGELLSARRLEVSSDQLALPEHRSHYFDRVLAELRRSFEHLERQFHRFPVGELLLAPMPEEFGLLEYLAENFYVPVRSIDLAELIDFPDAPVAGHTDQWAFFHLFGAALRVEPKAL